MRGRFIVFEGLDRSGKSSQAKSLVDHLIATGRKAKLIRFPARDSGPIGALINSYLSSATELPDEAIHLLFSANRWEVVPKLLEDLNSGIDVICDRYLYSGVAYSAAKGLPFSWCQGPDRLLPKPDLVLFLSVSPAVAAQRGDFGMERYEKVEFQAKVKQHFLTFLESERSYWQLIDADATQDEVGDKIRTAVESLTADGSVSQMWLGA
jgi:dTMP kinase